MAKLNQLRAHRRATKPTPSIEYVARFYRGGVTKQWLSQLEKARTVSPTIERDYKTALSAAIAAQKEAAEVMDAALSKLTPSAHSDLSSVI